MSWRDERGLLRSAKTIFVPSVDQLGKSGSPLPRTIRRRLVPLAFITQSPPSGAPGTYAICFPFGDHAGVSGASSWSAR